MYDKPFARVLYSLSRIYILLLYSMFVYFVFFFSFFPSVRTAPKKVGKCQGSYLSLISHTISSKKKEGKSYRMNKNRDLFLEIIRNP